MSFLRIDFRLTALIFIWLFASAIYNVEQIQAADYTAASTTFSMDTGVDAGSVLLGDNEVSGAISLPFSFSFFDVDYSSLYISSNGFITFLSGQPNGCCNSISIPNSSTPNGMIAGFFVNLDTQGGNISYETFGTAPDRRFVVYFNVSDYNFGNDAMFQIKLFETSNTIEIHCQSCISGSTPALQGIENENGTVAFTFGSRNAVDFNLTNDAVQFTLPSSGGSGSPESVPDLSTWAMIFLLIGGVYFLHREGILDLDFLTVK